MLEARHPGAELVDRKDAGSRTRQELFELAAEVRIELRSAPGCRHRKRQGDRPEPRPPAKREVTKARERGARPLAITGGLAPPRASP